MQGQYLTNLQIMRELRSFKGLIPPPNPNPTLPYSTQSPLLHPLHPYPSPLLLYPTILGYVRLGKDERYVGVVLGKNRFSKDVPLCYHEISLQFIQLYVLCTCRSKSTSILMCVCL